MVDVLRYGLIGVDVRGPSLALGEAWALVVVGLKTKEWKKWSMSCATA